MTSDKNLRCSFCGKDKETVKKFISGPNVYICNECISLCNEILAEEDERATSEKAIPSPTPEEIKSTPPFFTELANSNPGAPSLVKACFLSNQILAASNFE